MDKHGIKSISGTDDSIYYREKPDAGLWKAKDLYKFALEKNYPVIEIPLSAIDISVKAFETNTLKDFIFQCKRMNRTDMDFPIILDEYGQVADGFHRIARAFLEGKDTIKAIRMLEMPEKRQIEEL